MQMVSVIMPRLTPAQDGLLMPYMSKGTAGGVLYIHKVLAYIEYRAVSGIFRTIEPPPPLHPASVSSPRLKGGG
jgi:hypothetical protein